MKKMKGLIVFICIQISYASSVFAQYQWLDENNQMQFSDRPPPREIPESNIIKTSCEQQRNNLSALENGQRMSKFSENGERIFLEDNERDEEIAKIRNGIQQYCK